MKKTFVGVPLMFTYQLLLVSIKFCFEKWTENSGRACFLFSKPPGQLGRLTDNRPDKLFYLKVLWHIGVCNPMTLKSGRQGLIPGRAPPKLHDKMLQTQMRPSLLM